MKDEKYSLEKYHIIRFGPAGKKTIKKKLNLMFEINTKYMYVQM